MSRIPVTFLFVVCLLPACFLAKEYKQASFTYTANGQTASMPLIVPKGYVKEERIDTAGVMMHLFRYANGAFLYSAYVSDSTAQLQAINKSLHQPVGGPQGGLVYKGIDENELFYREIRRGPLRFGYRNVPESVELRFDSATNFAAQQGRR
jgi:hypothetical protein